MRVGWDSSPRLPSASKRRRENRPSPIGVLSSVLCASPRLTSGGQRELTQDSADQGTAERIKKHGFPGVAVAVDLNMKTTNKPVTQ